MKKLRHIPLLLAALALLLLTAVPSSDAQVRVTRSETRIEVNGSPYLLHKVNAGETLYAIGAAYEVAVREIIAANSLDPNDKLRKGQTLLIPVAVQAAPAPPATVTPQSAPQPESPQPGEVPVLGDEEEGSGEEPAFGPEGFGPQTAYASSMRHIQPGAAINIAVLLPLQEGQAAANAENFSDFYRGVLMGLDALKKRGVSTNTRFMNTGADPEKVRQLVASGAFDNVNLIIGPVYPEPFAVVSDYAAAHGVVAVSPLGSAGRADHPYIFEVAPPERYKYDKILPMLDTPGVNAFVIDHSETPDTLIYSQMELALQGRNLPSIAYSGTPRMKSEMTSKLNRMLNSGTENIVFAPVASRLAVENLLSDLSSIASMRRYNVTVIGTTRWGNFSDIKMDLYFKLNVQYPSTYYGDRSTPQGAEFYRNYMGAFGRLPNAFSMRGYDVAVFFGGGLAQFGENFLDRVGDYAPQLLQVKYEFAPVYPGGRFENHNWVVVNYTPDFSVVLK